MNAYKRKKTAPAIFKENRRAGKVPPQEKQQKKAKPENKKGRLRLPKTCPSFILNGKS